MQFFNKEEEKQHEAIIKALINNKVTTQIILDYLDLIGLSECNVVTMLATEIHTLLKEIYTISGIPSRFEHIDRHYYKAAIELLEKEGRVKTYGSVVQLVPTLEDRKKLLVERINNGRLDLIENLESTLDYYDRGDN